jgi:hypothetical protein
MPTPIPDSWDFTPEFLSAKAWLPPYLPSHDSPALGPGHRATAADIAPWFRTDALPSPKAHPPHAVALEGVHVLVDDRAADRYRLVGPARLELGEELLNRHLLVIGPPGVGKTTQVILPLTASLLGDRQRTVVVFDPKGDQFHVLQQLAVKAGRSRRDVWRLNLSDPLVSLGWNPLNAKLSRTEAHGIASALVMACEHKHSHDSPFWRNNSILLITGILLGLAAEGGDALTLPRVQEVLELPRDKLLGWLKLHRVHQFGTFLDSGSHNAETCLSDAAMRMVSLLDMDLCAVLSSNELQLAKLFDRPRVLVVEMDETRIERLRPIFNMLVQQIFDHGIAAASRHADARLRFPVSVVIDEFGSAIGAIPRFPTTLNTLRSRRISVIAAVQSIAQISGLYGGDQGAVLAGFSSKIFFPNVEIVDAEFASQMCGTMTLQLTTDIGAPVTWMSRRVYLPEEIARPKSHEVLGRPVTMLIADAELAVQAYLAPAYRLPGLRDLLDAQRGRKGRGRRRQPLVYVPASAREEKPTFTVALGLTPSVLTKLVQGKERALGLPPWQEPQPQFWMDWCSGPLKPLSARLRFLEEVAVLGAVMKDVQVALFESKAATPALALSYLRFLLERRQHESSGG